MIRSVSFIGSGRVATHLSQVLALHLEIKQIYSPHLEHAEKLAALCSAEALTELAELITVDLLIIAVSDQQISSVAEQLAQMNYQGLVVHTSGSTHMNILTEKKLNAGVIYPLQTFSFEHSVDWQNTPLFIEAEQSTHQNQLMLLAQKISQNCYAYTSKQRLSLHLAAVFACNFTNHCYDIAQQVLQQQQVDFKLLMPLILSTAHKLEHTSAYQNQTGPARRQDQNILQLHQHMLNDEPSWQNIYQIMSQSILKRFED